ncbi:hypothetical protein [Croceimicrobium sp.]|uniref:hypothetical protein n=1 Tax=Croceimicrobium sp. TaxID=2828340 RepID=UPI003BAC14A3
MRRHVSLHYYSLREGKEQEFIATWKLLNDLNFRYGGSLSSRIHRRANNYYEYILWPDRSTYLRSKSALPPAALALRARLRACCKKVDESLEMEVLEDLDNQHILKKAKV